MRPSQKSNRNRGRGSRKPNGSNINRVYESAGPEGKVRGTPQQIIEKYLTLARDAQTAGDRVMSENFLQHAEHYQRMVIEALGSRPERRDGFQPDQDQPDTDGQDDGLADDAGDEVIMMHPRGGQPRQDQRRQDQRRQDQHRQDQPQPGQPQPSGEPRLGQPQPGQPQSGDRRGRGERGRGRDTGFGDVSGLTMIDSGQPDGGSLLVDTEDLSVSQPPRRRPAAEEAPADAPSGGDQKTDQD